MSSSRGREDGTKEVFKGRIPFPNIKIFKPEYKRSDGVRERLQAFDQVLIPRGDQTSLKLLSISVTSLEKHASVGTQKSRAVGISSLIRLWVEGY